MSVHNNPVSTDQAVHHAQHTETLPTAEQKKTSGLAERISSQSSSGWFSGKISSWFGGSGKAKASEETPDETAKTQRVGNSFFGNVKSGLKSAFGKVVEAGTSKGLNIAKSIATYGYSPDSADRAVIEELRGYTGDDQFPALVHYASGKISSLVQASIASSDYSSAVKKFACQEKELVRQLINSGLLNISLNLAKAAQDKKGMDDTSQINIPDLIQSLIQVAGDSLPNFHEKMAQIEQIEDQSMREKALKNYVQPVIKNMMALAFPNGSGDIVGLNFGKAKLYQFIEQTVMPEIVSTLVKGHYTVYKKHAEAKKQLQEQLETEWKEGNASEVIEPTIKFLSKKLLDRLAASLKEGSDSLAQTLVDQDKPTPESLAIGQLIKGLSEAGKSSLSPVWNLARAQIETFIRKILYKQLKDHQGKIGGADIAELVLSISGNLAEKLSLEKSGAMDYQSLAKDLIKETSVNPEEDLPSLFGLNTIIAEQLESNILPKFLSSFREETAAWMKKKEQNQKELQALFGTTHPQEACKILGEYISQYAPWYLSTSCDKASEMLLTTLEKQVASDGSAEGAQLLHEIMHSRKQLKSFFRDVLKGIGDTTSSGSKKTWNFAREYSEACALEMFVRIARKIQQVEGAHEGGTAGVSAFETMTAMLKNTSEHSAPSKESLASEKGEAALDFAGLTSKLLGAADLLDGKEIPLPGKIKDGLWTFFKSSIIPHTLSEVMDKLDQDVTKDAFLLGVLKMLNDTVAQGGITPEGKGKKGSEAQKAFRLSLNKAFKENLTQLDPQTAMSLSLAAEKWLMETGETPSGNPDLQNLYDSLEGQITHFPEAERNQILSQAMSALAPLGTFALSCGKIQREEMPSPKEKHEQIQKAMQAEAQKVLQPFLGCLQPLAQAVRDKALNAECGNLIKDLVSKLPCSLVKDLFTNLEEMELLSAESIGELVRGYTDQANLFTIIDKALVQVIPHLHAGKWTGEPGKELFEPSGGKFHFDLPKTEEEKALHEAKRKRKSRIQHKKLLNEGAEAISHHLAGGITRFIHSLWDGFMNSVGQVLPPLKGFIDGIIHSSLVQAIISGIKWLFRPLLHVGKSLFKHTVVRPAMRRFTRKMHRASHKDLLYSWNELAADLLNSSVAEAREQDHKRVRRHQEELAEEVARKRKRA